MNLLHLFSNFRMTGPAEPVLNLCGELSRRGLNVTLAFGMPPNEAAGDLNDRVERMGLRTRRDLHLKKHLNFFSNRRDVRLLSQMIQDDAVDVLHVNMGNDHLIGAWAARRSARPVKIVRTSYEGAGLPNTWRNRWLLKNDHTDALIVFSHIAARTNAERFGFDPGRIFVVDGAVDLDRFSPDRALPPMRKQLGLAEDAFVVGIVARIQLRRRFPELLRAAQIASKNVPHLKLVIVGRGTKMHQAAVEPARKMGLDERVLFAGYHRGDDYVRVLDAFDAKVFMVPGTDGTCRAVREAMAMGKPVIACNRGLLGELVEDGGTGLVVDGSPESLAVAIETLARDAALRNRMGAAALEKARTRFSLARQAEQVEAVYAAVLGEADT